MLRVLPLDLEDVRASFHWSRKRLTQSLGAHAPPSVGARRGQAEGPPRCLGRRLPPEREDAPSSVGSGFRRTRHMESQGIRGSLPTSVRIFREFQSAFQIRLRLPTSACYSTIRAPPVLAELSATTSLFSQLHLDHVMFPRSLL